MPTVIPQLDATLPSLLDDLPGRAVVVINPNITTFNSPGEGWSGLDLMFFGVDGRWRRLAMEDLGVPNSNAYSDTYGSGELSSDGRWWAGPTYDGMVALNLSTGKIHLIPLTSTWGAATWVPGRPMLLTNGRLTSVPEGIEARVPYHSGAVGHEPDGTPLSLERNAVGDAVLVEWLGNTRKPRAVVPGVTPPRQQIADSPDRRIIASNQLSAVLPTHGQFASTELRGAQGAALVVADSTDGEQLAELTWERSDFSLSYETWLDEETLLVATAPYFVAWKPATGALFRVTDSRSLGKYWDVSIAADALVE